MPQTAARMEALGQERRKYARIAIHQAIAIKGRDNGHWHHGTTRDLSLGGTYFFSNRDFSENAEVEVRLADDTAGDQPAAQFRNRGRVVRVDCVVDTAGAAQRGSFGVAVAFDYGV